MTIYSLFADLDFLSATFYVCLAGLLLLYWAAPAACRKYVLLVFSLVFYALNGLWSLAAVLWVASAGWAGGRFLSGRGEKRGHTGLLTLFVALVFLPFLLGRILGIPALSGLLQLLAENRLPVTGLLSGIGVAYTSCMSVSYLADVYGGKVQPAAWADYMTFITFFPCALAGPIERAGRMLPQINAGLRRGEVFSSLERGLVLILYGLFAKLVVADRIAILVNEVFGRYQRYVGFELLTALVLYGIQLYCDFMACSAIARGVARCFGIELVRNFEQPYFARSIGDFWRRWHISLSSWLRDYVYIPLGGNRKGSLRTGINIALTFLASGLWHGFRLHFILWGLLHGLYQVLGRGTRPLRDRLSAALGLKKETLGAKLFQCGLTFILVDFAWLFFKLDSLRDIGGFLRNLAFGLEPGFFTAGYLTLGLDQPEWNVLLAGLLVVFIVDVLSAKYRASLETVFQKENLPGKCALIAALLTAVLLFGVYGNGYTGAAFIYRGF